MSETNAFEELIVIRSKGGDGTIWRQRPLVRCKDCAKYDRNTGICSNGITHGYAETWFCADGVAKDSNVLTK